MDLDKISLEELKNQLVEARLENNCLRSEIEFLRQNPSSESQNFYRFLTDNDTQNLILLDPEGKILAVSALASAASKTLYGKTLAPGGAITEVIPPEQVKHFSRLLNDTLAGRTASADFPLNTPDDQQRWVRYHFRPARKSNGKFSGVIVSTIEITEQKLAEKARLE